MTAQQAIALLDTLMPPLVKDALQRAGFQLEAFVEKFIDEQGPTSYPSGSPRWGSQTGRAARSLIPGTPDNVMRFTTQGGRFSMDYGSSVEYVKFLEEGTRFMPPRPALEPGFKAFEREALPKLLNDIMKEIARAFNR